MASSAVLRLAKTSGAFADLCRKDVSIVLCSPSSTRLRPGAGPRPQPRWRPAGASPGQRPRARPQQGEQLLCRVSAFSRSAWGCPCAGGAGVATAPQGAHFPLYGLSPPLWQSLHPRGADASAASTAKDSPQKPKGRSASCLRKSSRLGYEVVNLQRQAGEGGRGRGSFGRVSLLYRGVRGNVHVSCM